jgi:N-acetylmuramoyl-L-alanine amidase
VAKRALNLVTAVVLLLSAAATAAERTPARAPDPYPVATDARLGGDEAKTRFVMDLSAKVDLRAFALADPYRVVIDLPQVTFKLPPQTGRLGRGLIKAYRFGLVMQGGSRLVFDVSKPVRIDRAFVLDPAEGQPARLVVELTAIEREAFLRQLALEKQPLRIPPPARPAPPNKGDVRPLIVLDPGHGGVDFGTQSSAGITEKSIVLDFALILRDLLEKSGKYRVAMTRSDDTFVPLGERVHFARQRHAALFISIHADALRKIEGDAQGATIYTLSETASDVEAQRLAETENRADVIAGIDLSHEPGDVADILIDLAQRETKAFSLMFARDLWGELKPVARLHKNPLKSAGFKVLKAPDVPSVLLELGYVSSKDDLKMLTSRAWQTRSATAIGQAIDAFFATRLAGSPRP